MSDEHEFDEKPWEPENKVKGNWIMLLCSMTLVSMLVYFWHSGGSFDDLLRGRFPSLLVAEPQRIKPIMQHALGLPTDDEAMRNAKAFQSLVQTMREELAKPSH